MAAFHLPGDDEPLPALHARRTRRAGARGIGRRHTRKLAMRRLGVLALACAVPAMAGPLQLGVQPASAGTASLAQSEVNPGGQPMVDAGFLPAFAQLASAVLPFGETATASALPGTLDSGPAALPLVARGSDLDHARAQQCLTQAIYYEAASEPDEGQRAVAQVVLNRVAHPAWPNNVCGVVYQGSERSTGCQFTFTCDGSLARTPSASGWRRAARVAREALAGVVYAPVGLATHYHTTAVNPYWASSLDAVGVIGAHIFYRWTGAAGSRSAFSARYRGGEPLPGRTPESPPAPDPLAPPPLPAMGVIPVEAAIAAPAALPSASPDALPASGTVRSEYAQSGTWLRQP